MPGRVKCSAGCECRKHSPSDVHRARVAEAAKGNTNGRGNKGKRHDGQALINLQSNMTIARKTSQTAEAKEKRAKSLSEVMFKPSSLERRVHALLDRIGEEYVVHPVVTVEMHPGRGRRLRPDILIPARRMLIEVNGCYVHGCETCYGDRGLVQNRASDEERIKAFSRLGYDVLVLWEHDLDALELADRL